MSREISKNVAFAMLLFLSLAVTSSSAQGPLGQVSIALSNTETANYTGTVFFEPKELSKVREGNSFHVFWFTNITDPSVHRFEAKMSSTFEAEVTSVGDLTVMTELDEVPEELTNITMQGQVTYYGEVNVSAVFVGQTSLFVTLYDENNKTLAVGEMEMTVLLARQLINTIFTYVVAVLVGILYFFMGATLDLKIVKGIIKKPVGPALGAICQYGVMPGISFALGLLFFPEDINLRLGLFLNGCSPGGGSSNMWTHLLGGSLDLSIMMTAVSTILAFGTVPMWVLTVGPVIVAGGNFVIPFMEIIVTVISLILPCVIGIVAQYFFPKIIPYCQKTLTPFSIFILVFIFTVGVYAYLYAFYIMTWRSLLAGLLLPLMGYILGLILSRIFRQPWENCIAISVETGVQNTTIAIIILNVAIPAPVSNLASVVPVTNTLFTPLPLIVACIFRAIYQKTCGKNKGKKDAIDAAPSSNLKDIPADAMITNGTVKKPTDVEVQYANPKVEGVVNPAAELSDNH